MENYNTLENIFKLLGSKRTVEDVLKDRGITIVKPEIIDLTIEPVIGEMIDLTIEPVINEIIDLTIEPVINEVQEKYILILDTETTGFSPQNNHIVQFAYNLCRRDGSLVEEKSILIKPGKFDPTNPAVPIHARYHYMPKGSFEVHKISFQKAQKDGIHIDEFVDAFREILNKTEHVVAHNYNFDSKFVAAELMRVNAAALAELFLAIPHTCTMTTPSGKIKLTELYQKKFDRAMPGNNHDALWDTIACKHIYFGKCDI